MALIQSLGQGGSGAKRSAEPMILKRPHWYFEAFPGNPSCGLGSHAVMALFLDRMEDLDGQMLKRLSKTQHSQHSHSTMTHGAAKMFIESAKKRQFLNDTVEG